MNSSLNTYKSIQITHVAVQSYQPEMIKHMGWFKLQNLATSRRRGTEINPNMR
jgi:hypothetical protein